MSDENDWMDDESHADLKSSLVDAYAESKRLREALKAIENGVENADRW